MEHDEIAILHLSDIHFFKQKDKRRVQENKAFRQTVQERLLEAVKIHAGRVAKPDVAVITGDIAFSGKQSEYEDALDFFQQLKNLLPETEFLAVPGNHDVDRDAVDEFLPPYYVVKNDRVERFLEKPEQVEKKVNVKFTAFREFSRQLNPAFYEAENGYFWVKNFPDKKVSFLGLNSAWASEGDEDRFNIALGFPQVKAALEKAKNIPNRIVLMHHPPFNWLKDFEYGGTRVELFRQCPLLLHGHTHSDNALVLKDPSDTCICLGANASYTDEKQGFIGFQFINVEFKENGASVTVWPYKWETGRNEFVPHRERWRGQKGGDYFKIDTSAPVEEKNYGGKTPLPFIPEDYKTWLREFHSVLPVDQLARKGEVVTISLPAVYIPLDTVNPFYEPLTGKDMEEGMEKESREPPFIDIEELAGRQNCLLLRGDAGTGKTTLVKHLAYSLAHGTGPAPLRGCLPVILFLKDLVPIYENKVKQEPGKISFEMLLEIYLEDEDQRRRHRCPLTMETLNAFLGHHRALILLDGLDEVPEKIRGDLVNLVHRFQFAHKENRFLITGRPHGIEGRARLCFGKYLKSIEPLNNKKSREFISRWFQAVSGQAKGLGKIDAARLIDDIVQHEHARIFTENPLLLTALCIFYLVGGKRIPDQRADLYDRIVSNLLYRRFHDPAEPGNVNRVREFLAHLAFVMHTGHNKNIETYSAVELLKLINRPFEYEDAFDYKKRMKDRFDGIEPVCGLLNRQIGGEIEFAHLSFQEFLAAKHMLDRDIDYKPYLEDPWWKEVILLYTGLMNLDMKTQSNKIAIDMLENSKTTRIQLLGAQSLWDFETSRREESAIKSAQKILLNIIQSDAKLQERFEAGNLLGVLGDPRINVFSPPLATVPAGKFTRGAGEHLDESPKRLIYLDEFEIGKYRSLIANSTYLSKTAVMKTKRTGPWKAGNGSGKKKFPNRNIGMTVNGTAPISRWWESVGMKPWHMSIG
jgi:predicted MPP superfamily phosphohydrolase/energy-coupling factor transporter ATP-binding protein EcfA2